jgi:hypothetical protein
LAISAIWTLPLRVNGFATSLLPGCADGGYEIGPMTGKPVPPDCAARPDAA